jgi:hypothetical protein
MEAWVGIVGTLLGGALGGYLTYLTSSAQAKREMRWQQIRLSQEKLEELAKVLDQYDYHYKKISGEAFLKVEIGKPMSFDGERFPTARLAALIQFYAPELKDHKIKLDELTRKHGAVLAEAIKDTKRDKPEKQELNAKLIFGAHEISDLCAEMVSKAAEINHRKVATEMSNNSVNTVWLFRWRSKANRLR